MSLILSTIFFNGILFVVTFAQSDIAGSTSDTAYVEAYPNNSSDPNQASNDQVLSETPCYGGDSGFCSQSVNLTAYPGEDCYRECFGGEKPKVCYFKFIMEHYHAMGPACGNCGKGVEADCYHPQCIPADGIERGVMSINRQIPAPRINVCQNDLVVVDVENHMSGSSSTIHWHGLHHRETPYMDGVPFVTQCPIEYSTGFRYTFWAREPGSQFFHSHSGHQKVNGIFGTLTVRRPKTADPNSYEYDFDSPDHTFITADWMHDMAEMYMPGLPTRPGGMNPANILINGNGRYTDPKTGTTTKTPLHIFKVQHGYRYRFRFINSASHVCGTQVQVEKHKMLVIASDSFDVHGVEIDTFVSNSGERYDFVVNASQPVGDYWIRVRAIGNCLPRRIEQFAILRYVSDSEPQTRVPPDFDSPYPEGVILNKQTTNCNNPPPNEYCITNLRALYVDEEMKVAVPDHKFYLTFNNYVVSPEQVFRPGIYEHFINVGGNILLMAGINNISLTLPSVPPLTQPDDIDESMFCDEDTRPTRCANQRLCPCTHRLRVEYGSIVELVIVDETERRSSLSHPFHLHGFGMTVTNMGQHPDGIPMTRSLYQQMEIMRSVPPAPEGEAPAYKDTVSIPSKGFIVVRFRATNRGFWLMHCHFDWHMAVGMAFVFQVGETHHMLKAPKNFPKCGNFKPDVYELIKNL